MENYEHRLTAVESSIKSNTRRIEDLEKRADDLNDLISSVKTLAIRQETVENTVIEIKTDVKSLANKPAQRWDNLVDKIVMLLVAAIVGFILAKIGL